MQEKMTVKEFKNIDTYKKLIEYYFDKCDTVMFIANKDGFDENKIRELEYNMHILEKKLKASFIKFIHRSHWVFRTIGANLKDQDNLFTVYFYKFTEEVKEYLLSNQNMYSWLNPKYPEDLSFFRNGWCLFNTITHEEMCDIEVENEEEYKYLISIGVEFYEEKFIKSKKEDMYYEDI